MTLGSSHYMYPIILPKQPPRPFAPPHVKEAAMPFTALEADLCCPVCARYFDDPHVLPCFHRICRRGPPPLAQHARVFRLFT